MQHLRIGSYLRHNGCVIILDRKRLANILLHGTKGYKAIKLTKDVLLLCGFYKVKNEYNIYAIGRMKIHLIGSFVFFDLSKQSIKTLHELQNIAFYLHRIKLEYLYND